MSRTVMRAPPVKRWSTAEFHRLGDAGLFEGQNLILVDGEFLEMPPPNPPHDMALILLDAVLRACFPTGHVFRTQMSLVLGQTTDPVPDYAVVAGSARDFVQKPTTAVLVVEVADSSLDYDTGDKASLYAASGIADYWVVDLVNRRLIVMRDPMADAAARHGVRYSTVTAVAIGQSASPLAAPASKVAVADLMP
jgi:Uma2 family endonuclease